MTYAIEPMSLITFVDGKKIKLPRFQRKATWSKKQNFELAISIFQYYPVGVVILNEINGSSTSFLLDGRQRRNALKKMREDPVELYEWARNYIGFSKNDDEKSVSDVYWNKVAKFLLSEEPSGNDDATVVSEYGGEEYEAAENSFNMVQQRKGLQLLLNLILMVHQVTPKGSRWQRLFDFRDYCDRLAYIVAKDNNKVSPILLRKFIIELDKSADDNNDGDVTEDFFVEYYCEKYYIKDIAGFKQIVNNNWKDISESITYIKESENIFNDARIAAIKISNASDLDAQIIFSRINTGGTQLKAEELLSAKPYWNKEVNVSDYRIKDIVQKMYKKIDIPTNEKVVRWDIAATLISRIDDADLLFDSTQSSKNEISLDQLTLGFKLLSSVFIGGMTAKDVIEIEDSSISWERDVEELVSDINKICYILSYDKFFAALMSWKYPITKLLGNAIALEFITIIYKDWIDKGEPMLGSAQLNAFCMDARILFDRLVYEYTSKNWRGSGDSKMSNDIKHWRDRIKPIDESSWRGLIAKCFDGNIDGQETTIKLLKPILYYYYASKGIGPINNVNAVFDVDHIIPQAQFAGVASGLNILKNSLGNMCLLPKCSNISKNDKLLSQITDPWLKKQIETYSEIQQADFANYTSANDVINLKAKRILLYDDGVNAGQNTTIGIRKVLLGLP